MAEDYPVNVVFKAMDRVSQPVQRINNRIERLTGPVRRFNNRMRALGRNAGLQQITAAAGRVRGALGRVSAAAGRVMTRLGIIGGLGAGAVARVVSNVADMGDEFAKSARSMGISVDFLQEYQFAAERLGVTKKTLNTSLVAFSKRLGEMKNGYGRLRTLLKETNPELQAQLETADSTEKAFQLLMDAMSQMEDPSRRSALAAAAFSRQGVRLTNIAQAGSEEVARLRDRARELGLIMDSNATGSAEKYQDALTNMKAALTGASIVVSTQLMPVFTDLMAKFTHWLVDNKAAVKEWASAFSTNIPDYLRAIREGATSLFDAMGPLVATAQWLFDTFGTGETILAAVGAVIGGPLIAAMASLVPAVVALGTAIGFTPIGWFIAGIAGIAAGIYGLKKAVDWLEQRFPAAFQVAQDAFGVLVDALLAPISIITGDFDGLMAKVERMGATFDKYFPNAKETWNTFVAAIKAPFGWMFEKFDSFMEKIRGIGETIDKYLPDWFSDWISGDSNAQLNVTTNAGGDIQRGATPGPPGGASGAVTAQTRTERRESRVQIDFDNLPAGARVTQEGDTGDVDLSMGLPMRGGG